MVQTIFALLAGSVILDALVRPRSSSRFPVRSVAGTWLLLLQAGVPFGLFLAISGNASASLVLALAFVGLFTMVSNAKRAMLGEPLLFSDLALIGGVFRHPQFYLSALTWVQKAALVLAAPVVPGLLFWQFRPDQEAHLAGLAIVAACPMMLWLSLSLPPWSRLAHEPDHQADVLRHGLLATILLYWVRWRNCADSGPPPAVAVKPAAGELVVLVQCESFADPVEIFGDPALVLPGLAAARAQAWQWGDLLVSGFGAYTMRTEYGVLFGRSEADLGFRRFDPFLTATGEAGFALPARLSLGGWRSLFVHPHDMRFYNRAQIMRAAGFAELVGEDSFPPPEPGEGRYVTDAAMADAIIDLARSAEDPLLIYAVTIENHGPWEAKAGETDLAAGYVRLVCKGDAMLAKLTAELASLKRPATLVFFGDHRPSIPGVAVPDGPRHTPYVVIQLDANGKVVPGDGCSVDLTPAELHHTLLGLLSSSDREA